MGITDIVPGPAIAQTERQPAWLLSEVGQLEDARQLDAIVSAQ
jgi:hypothetical protein